MVMLLGLARRTANKSEKVPLLYALVRRDDVIIKAATVVISDEKHRVLPAGAGPQGFVDIFVEALTLGDIVAGCNAEAGLSKIARERPNRNGVASLRWSQASPGGERKEKAGSVPAAASE